MHKRGNWEGSLGPKEKKKKKKSNDIRVVFFIYSGTPLI